MRRMGQRSQHSRTRSQGPPTGHQKEKWKQNSDCGTGGMNGNLHKQPMTPTARKCRDPKNKRAVGELMPQQRDILPSNHSCETPNRGGLVYGRVSPCTKSPQGNCGAPRKCLEKWLIRHMTNKNAVIGASWGMLQLVGPWPKT